MLGDDYLASWLIPFSESAITARTSVAFGNLAGSLTTPATYKKRNRIDTVILEYFNIKELALPNFAFGNLAGSLTTPATYKKREIEFTLLF